jgi:hypothetical protein
MFLTFEDCLGLADITEAEALAIAAHQGIPPMAAVQLGDYLMKTPEGELCLKTILREDIADAIASGDPIRTLALRAILREYILRHPRCEARHRAALHAPERRAGA